MAENECDHAIVSIDKMMRIDQCHCDKCGKMVDSKYVYIYLSRMRHTLDTMLYMLERLGIKGDG